MNVQLSLEDVLDRHESSIAKDALMNGTATIKEAIKCVLNDRGRPGTYEQIGTSVRDYGYKWSHETIGRRVRELARDGEIRTKTVESVIEGKNKRYSVFYI